MHFVYIKRVSGENLEQLQREIDQVLDQDLKATGLLSVPEFGSTTGAVLRAELGDLARSTHIDQVFAYVGLDLQVKQSGKWKGQTKLSKHGSGRVRRILYLAALCSIHQEASPFGASYQRLVARGMKKGMASPPQRLRQQSLWTMFRGQGTVVCGIAWTRGLTNSMACFYSENRVG
jgi:transposase